MSGVRAIIDDLIAFVKARLDEDEAAAKAEGGKRWEARSPGGQLPPGLTAGPGVFLRSSEIGRLASTNTRDHAAHIARHDPARVLREVAATRVLLDRYARLQGQQARHAAAVAEYSEHIAEEERTGRWPGPGDPGTRSRALLREGDLLAALGGELRLLILARAAAWNYHPDYMPGWAP